MFDISTTGDALGYGQRDNHVSYYCKENMEKVEAGAELHYYNTKMQDDSPIGKIMHDFQTACVDDMHDAVLQKHVRYYKETKEGMDHMCKVMDKIHKDGEREGFRNGEKTGEKRKSKMIARNLYESGMPIQEIMKHTRESEPQIRKWVNG